MKFECLSTKHLLEAYLKAVELNLDNEFVILLKRELDNRSIIPKETY